MFSLEAAVHCSANLISGGIHQRLLTKNWTEILVLCTVLVPRENKLVQRIFINFYSIAG